MLSALTALAGLEFRALARRSIQAGACLVLAGILAVAAAAYALSALHVVLEARFGDIEATLMIAAGLLLLAIASGAFALYVNRRRRSDASRAAMLLVAAPAAGSLLRILAPSLLRIAPLMLIAGVLAGRYITRK